MPVDLHLHDTVSVTDAFNATVVSLEQEADRERLSVADQVSLRDADLRDWMAKYVMPVFLGTNLVILTVLGLLIWLDQSNIESNLIRPSDRIIGSQVIMALLGATTVQVGAIAALIARYLFRGRQP